MINKRNVLTYLLQGVYAFAFVWIMLGVLSFFAVHFEWWGFWSFLVCLAITPFYFRYMPKFKTMKPSIWLGGAKDLYSDGSIPIKEKGDELTVADIREVGRAVAKKIIKEKKLSDKK